MDSTSPASLVDMPGAFEPLAGEARVQKLSRPSLSYWKDAWIRLRANRRAIISLYIIIALLVFTLAGPLVWTVDPSDQDLLQVNRPPGAERSAVIVEPYHQWSEPPVAAANGGLELAAPGTTQAVRLVWPAIPGADGYRVYRDIVPTEEGKPLGLPLMVLDSNSGTYYDDLLNLQPGTFYYSVVPLNREGDELAQRKSLKVKVVNAITLAEASDLGLLKPGDHYKVGDRIEYPLHPFGTDYLGRDMLARLMQGARVSLFIGIVAPLLYVLIGVTYGGAAGFVGGRTDQILMRFADFVIALPFLLFMILFKIAFGIGPGESGIVPMIVAMVILLWPGTARLVRGQILQVREEGYVQAARLLGARNSYLVLRHMIPNTMGVILVTLTFAIPSAIFTEAFLSFIGMGVAPPTASWGSMSNDGIKTMLTHPHELLFPALMISITVLAFNLLGDGLRDALDAKMRSRE
jgi:oligopeptide transport system permease protein